MKFPTMDEFAESVAKKALDEIEYEGKTLREWVKIILATDTNVATKHGTNLAEVGTDCSEFPNNSDTISRQAAIETAKKMYVACDTNSIDDYEMLMEEALKVLPSAEPMRKKGEWVSPFGIGCVCNCCGYDINEHGIDIRVDGEPNFCPNCGAKMEVEHENN